jgi:hypothetical protein
MTFIKKLFRFIWKILTGGDSIRMRRLFLSNLISKRFNNIVHYGPFKGLILGRGVWSSTDRAGMILGLYEQEVLNSISKLPKKYTNFIDLGAADGYYAIGVLINKIFLKSYCFEMSRKGQEVIRENAELNHVSNDVIIHGKATSDFYHLIPNCNLDNSVLLVDIEGCEFDLLDHDCLKAFSRSIIFIELHDWLVDDGFFKKNQLIERAKLFFNITELTTGSRDLSVFDELRDFSDTDRWLICSEGRDRRMTWLRLDPI